MLSSHRSSSPGRSASISACVGLPRASSAPSIIDFRSAVSLLRVPFFLPPRCSSGADPRPDIACFAISAMRPRPGRRAPERVQPAPGCRRRPATRSCRRLRDSRAMCRRSPGIGREFARPHHLLEGVVADAGTRAAGLLDCVAHGLWLWFGRAWYDTIHAIVGPRAHRAGAVARRYLVRFRRQIPGCTPLSVP